MLAVLIRVRTKVTPVTAQSTGVICKFLRNKVRFTPVAQQKTGDM
jgi:hypothetical protein